MPQLIIDTSSTHCLLGLLQEGKIIDSLTYPHANALSETLLPTLQDLLKKYPPLAAIYAGMGPGSYTGTRVGVAVAKSLSFALKIPFRGFCSLLAFLPEAPGNFSLILPTRLKQFYLAKGAQDAACVTVEMTGLCTAEELLQRVEPHDLLCCDTPVQLPMELHKVSILPLTPNFISLGRFLHTTPHLLNESDELIYLHEVHT